MEGSLVFVCLFVQVGRRSNVSASAESMIEHEPSSSSTCFLFCSHCQSPETWGMMARVLYVQRFPFSLAVDSFLLYSSAVDILSYYLLLPSIRLSLITCNPQRGRLSSPGGLLAPNFTVQGKPQRNEEGNYKNLIQYISQDVFSPFFHFLAQCGDVRTIEYSDLHFITFHHKK